MPQDLAAGAPRENVVDQMSPLALWCWVLLLVLLLDAVLGFGIIVGIRALVDWLGP